VPQCSAHGLRKAAATRLANAGCSSDQIRAITGHRSLSEVHTTPAPPINGGSPGNGVIEELTRFAPTSRLSEIFGC
jgi:Phage integrase family